LGVAETLLSAAGGDGERAARIRDAADLFAETRADRGVPAVPSPAPPPPR